MLQNYPIVLNSERVGTVQVEKTGLYYLLHCICTFSRAGMYEIYMESEKGTENLGLCVPEGSDFTLTKRIPVKKIPKGELYFIATEKDSKERKILPVLRDVPFLHLSELDQAVYVFQNNTAGIIIGSGCCHPKEAGFLDP